LGAGVREFSLGDGLLLPNNPSEGARPVSRQRVGLAAYAKLGVLSQRYTSVYRPLRLPAIGDLVFGVPVRRHSATSLSQLRSFGSAGLPRCHPFCGVFPPPGFVASHHPGSSLCCLLAFVEGLGATLLTPSQLLVVVPGWGVLPIPSSLLLSLFGGWGGR
jgi:hypothetical protein